ncbi:MAG: alpha/beta hydrolase [Deltaproteobacteria bacterium]|nr:alpha/beta hydrolase [Deltaproteobacteria bacterium]
MTVLSIVNGIVGDTFERKKSPFAIPMEFYAEGKPLPLTKAALAGMNLPQTGKISILMHGSCASQTSWGFKGNPSKNYGLLLKKDAGFTPFFVRYNSGLHISTNGKRLSDLLERLIRNYPVEVTDIVLIGHSMGGLIYRSACHYGEMGKKKWVRLIRKIFYLGSPHLGTHFEKFGKLTTAILQRIPNPATRALARFIDLRSDGIKDMRHGYIIDDDWNHGHSEKLFYLHQNKIPLLKSADHYLICSTLSKRADSIMGRFFGDGLVHPGSGIGRGLFSGSNIPFPKKHCKILPGLSHHNLQKSPRVYRQIRAWCEGGSIQSTSRRNQSP